MKERFRCRFSSILLVFFLWQLFFSFAAVLPAKAADDETINDALFDVCRYVNNNITSFTGGEAGWAALGIRKAGRLEAVLANPQSPKDPSDYARLIMGGLARGEDISSYVQVLQGMQRDGGYFSATGSEDTLNQTIWAVIALNMAKKNGVSVSYNETAAVNYVCSKQKPEGDPYAGGFDESGFGVDIDSTAHALIALAPYKSTVSDTVYKAVNFLKAKQNDNAGFGFYIWDGTEYQSESPDSIAAVIEALVALGIDPQGNDWKKGDKTMVDALLFYQLPEGYFYAPWAPGTANAMTTRNALLALADLKKVEGSYVSKYYNPLPPIDKFYISINAPVSLNAGYDWNFSLKLNNPESGDKESLTLAGLYKLEQGKPEKMLYYTALEKTVAPGESESVSGGMSVPESGSYEIRVMVWDNWQDKTPLTSPLVFKLES